MDVSFQKFLTIFGEYLIRSYTLFNAGISLFEREALIQGQEKDVEPRIVLQTDPYGCGVACLAMVVEVEYTAARSIFVDILPAL